MLTLHFTDKKPIEQLTNAEIISQWPNESTPKIKVSAIVIFNGHMEYRYDIPQIEKIPAYHEAILSHYARRPGKLEIRYYRRSEPSGYMYTLCRD